MLLKSFNAAAAYQQLLELAALTFCRAAAQYK
jgi:hypothetical protein